MQALIAVDRRVQCIAELRWDRPRGTLSHRCWVHVYHPHRMAQFGADTFGKITNATADIYNDAVPIGLPYQFCEIPGLIANKTHRDRIRRFVRPESRCCKSEFICRSSFLLSIIFASVIGQQGQ